MKKELEIYIHIPFCVKKCAYCDFLSGPADGKTIEQYVEGLIREISTHGVSARKAMVTTIFFGGGTPSLLNGSQMQKIMDVLRENFELPEDAEISMEANPGTVTAKNLDAYKKAGINRISFGLQSADNEELRLLGRIHTFEDFLESFKLARASGFDNINVDLISAIPRQTIKSWEESIQKVIELEPEHISAYSLIIEEGTSFARLYGEGTKGASELPSEDDERRLYQLTGESLERAGYHRYEISNYAKVGKECRHNLGYWERKNYLGIGLGASSLMDNVRYKNTDDLQKYLRQAANLQVIQENREVLSMEEQMEEYIFLGLRKMQGISCNAFEDIFGKSLKECYGKNIERMVQAELLVIEDDFLKLTQKGIDVSNYVFAEILN